MKCSPATDSCVIKTDSQILTLCSAKPYLLHDQIEIRGLISLYLRGLLVAWMVSWCPGGMMYRYDIDLDCCTERCTC